MKKLFISVLLFLCFINVEAKDYYSSYSSFSDWSTNEVEPSDTVSVEKAIRYKYYHEDIEGDYYLEDENDPKYNLKDETKYYYTDFTDYSKIEPETKKNRVIEKINGYEYRNALKVKYIMINDTHGSNNKLYITEIKVLDSNNNDINYNVITCEGCNNEFTNYIHNGDTLDYNSFVSNRSFVYLELDNTYYFDEITIKVYMNDTTNEYKSFYITLGTQRQYHLRYNYYSEFNSDNKEETFNYINMIHDVEWGSSNISLDEVKPNLHTQVNQIPLYRYKDKYIYYYNSNKIYSDYLTKPTTYYNKQSDDSIYLYRYKKRDKISIQDNIVITDYKESIDNYYESTVPVKIEGNIDMFSNGTYHVSFITPFKTIEKDIIVNIKNNTIKDKLIEENNDIKTKYDKLLLDYNDRIKTIEEDSQKSNIETYNKMIDDINKYKLKINELNMKLEESKQTISNKEKEKNKISKEYENELLNLRFAEPKQKVESDSGTRTLPLLTIQKPYFLIPLIFVLLVLITYIVYKKVKERRNNVRDR